MTEENKEMSFADKLGAAASGVLRQMNEAFAAVSPDILVNSHADNCKELDNLIPPNGPVSASCEAFKAEQAARQAGRK